MEYGFNISELYDALMEEHKRRERQHYLEQKTKNISKAPTTNNVKTFYKPQKMFYNTNPDNNFSV